MACRVLQRSAMSVVRSTSRAAALSAVGGLRADVRGALAVEYVILVGCVALAIAAGFQAFGGAVAEKTFCQGRAVLTLSTGDCSAADQSLDPLLATVEASTVSAAEDSQRHSDGCANGWRGILCRTAQAGGDHVRDTLGGLPGGDFIADYATAAWSLPDAILQGALPLFGAGGAGAPGVVESWTATGKQLAALGCASLPGTCSTLDSGFVPGFARGEATQIQIDAGKSLVGWDHWADGEYGTAAGTLLPNVALLLAPGPKVTSVARSPRAPLYGSAPNAPSDGVAVQTAIPVWRPGDPAVPNVNPEGSMTNCVNCSVAMHETIEGRPTFAQSSAGKELSSLEELYGAKFTYSTRERIVRHLLDAGDGSQAIIAGLDSWGMSGYVFNAVNDGGVVRFVDGQIGMEASLDSYAQIAFMPIPK